MSMHLILKNALLFVKRLLFCSQDLGRFAADVAMPLRAIQHSAGVPYIDGCFHLVPCQDPELDASFRQLLDTVSYTLQSHPLGS